MKPAMQQRYSFGAFVLDPAEKALLRGGKPVSLPPKAYETLLALVERHGHILEKADLLSRVWPETFVEEATLAQNIFTLRKVLGESAEGHQYIETLPKRGYRFVAAVKTGDGEERTGIASPDIVATSVSPASRWIYGLAAVILVLVAVVAAFLVRGRLWRSARAPAGKTMLAVLPFENLSGDPQQEYFSDGLTEEMITQLGKLDPSRLGVIARTSVMHYKKNPATANQIGRELGVDYILEGSVRRQADRVRVSAQLIQVRDQTHLWAQDYDRDLRDILGLEGDVARKIAAQIELKLTPQQQAGLAQIHRVNPEAYEAYLRGRYYWNRRTPESLKKSVEQFEYAIARDPGYTLAYAGLADSYNILGNFSLLAPREAYPRAKKAAKKALELDDSLGEAHTALGFATYLFDWDWQAAEQEFKRAIALNPNYGPAHQWYGVSLISRGRADEAIAEVKRAAEAEPLSMIISAVVGWVYYLNREYDQTIQQSRRTLELDAGFSMAHYYMGLAYEQKGMHEEAIAEFLKVEHARDLPSVAGSLGYAYARSGKKNEARALIREMRERSKRGYFPANQIALVYAGLGDKDQALEWLQKAYQQRYPWLIDLKAEPMFVGLHSKPEFQELVRRVGLPQ